MKTPFSSAEITYIKNKDAIYQRHGTINENALPGSVSPRNKITTIQSNKIKLNALYYEIKQLHQPTYDMLDVSLSVTLHRSRKCLDKLTLSSTRDLSSHSLSCLIGSICHVTEILCRDWVPIRGRCRSTSGLQLPSCSNLSGRHLGCKNALVYPDDMIVDKFC